MPKKKTTHEDFLLFWQKGVGVKVTIFLFLAASSRKTTENESWNKRKSHYDINYTFFFFNNIDQKILLEKAGKPATKSRLNNTQFRNRPLKSKQSFTKYRRETSK